MQNSNRKGRAWSRTPAASHRSEFPPAIPRQVAPQQSLPPLHQLSELCNIESVVSNEPAKTKTFRLDFYVRQRIIVRLDFYVRQWAMMFSGDS